jgi:hypothetical protein
MQLKLTASLFLFKSSCTVPVPVPVVQGIIYTASDGPEKSGILLWCLGGGGEGGIVKGACHPLTWSRGEFTSVQFLDVTFLYTSYLTCGPLLYTKHNTRAHDFSP